MSLFKNGMMRKPDKAVLRKVIMPEKNVIKKEDITKCGTYVIDGGAPFYLHGKMVKRHEVQCHC